VLAEIAPEGYADAGHLIPLLSAGLVAPSVYRMLSKTAKFGNKPRFFIGGAVFAALLFIGTCLLLIPPLGIWAPPIAMMVAFSLPAVVIMVKDQRGRSPADLLVRSFALAAAAAIAIGGAYYLLDPPGAFLQVALAVGGMLLWLALMPMIGAVPSYHRGPIVEMVRGLLGRRGKRFDEAAVIESLNKRQRRAVRLAVIQGRPLEEVAERLDRKEEAVARQLVRTLRRFAADGDLPSARRTRQDAAIGRFLFARIAPVDRIAYGRQLMGSGGVDSGDLHELEQIREELKRTSGSDWRK